jgi:protein gp37
MSLNGRTKIEWCDCTWNPVWGCFGTCPYCYARRTAKRYGKQVAGRDDFVPTWVQRNFDKPMPKRPSRIFVNSMSDIAYWMPEWMEAVKAKILEHPEHLFLFLTKYPGETMRFDLHHISNVMIGFSATDTLALQLGGIAWFLESGVISFLSVEPILAPLRLSVLDPNLLKWVIVGAETGRRQGRVVPDVQWIEQIYYYCQDHGIPLFMKNSIRGIQLGEPFDFVTEFPKVDTA